MKIEEAEKFEIFVGKKVFLAPTGNARFYGAVDKGTVSKIGSKYFYVRISESGWREVKFDKEEYESHCDDCNAGYIIFSSEKERIELIEAEKMLEEIVSFVRSYSKKIYVSSVRKIYEIIKQEEKKDED